MSKSDPDSAIFMEDAASDVERKINNAYCPSSPEEPKPAVSSDKPIDEGLQSMHLVEDDLKNPCLDYICHIIFSAPNATFTAGSKTFTDFPSVKEAFLSQEISEQDLKTGLINALNELLEPVRKHFNDDAHAKNLLAQVQQFKKEAAATKTESKVRRLDLVASGKVPAGAHLVFAGLPNANPTLQEAMDIIFQLRKGQDKPCVLFLSDWSALVCNACDGETKNIAAYYTVLVASLKVLDPSLMGKVTVIYQSDAILSDPSNYWISVINVGRHFMLNDVMGEDVKDADGAGTVVSRLMKVADVLGVVPATLTMSEGPSFQAESTMVNRFFSESLAGSVTAPTVTEFKATAIRLQPVRESEAYKTENDEYFLLDDPKVSDMAWNSSRSWKYGLKDVSLTRPIKSKVHGKAKMKKAFCEPGNISFCPPIALASALAFDLTNSTFTVNRSDSNGGDISFSTSSEVSASFADGSLHPGDIKAAASSLIVEVLDKMASTMKLDGEASKAAKSLKALQKKLAKRKK
jgi:tyrosyl-tRNA synthetase